ncbi:MAG: hypothetical protein H8E34_14100 [Bacteroidetes bacterium]|nr:hypothetical protein [Bacteroidota bacterium]
MNSKIIALRISGTIFGIVALLHLSRLLTGISVLIGDWTLPIWVNIFGFIASATLSTWLWWLSQK